MGYQVYLLCFSRPYETGAVKGGRERRHYIGISRRLEARLEDHRTGHRGSKFLKAVAGRGISWEVARTWEAADYSEAHALETQLKTRTESALLCPHCRPARLAVKRERESARRAKSKSPALTAGQICPPAAAGYSEVF